MKSGGEQCSDVQEGSSDFTGFLNGSWISKIIPRRIMYTLLGSWREYRRRSECSRQSNGSGIFVGE